MKKDLIFSIKNLWYYHQHKNLKVLFFKKPKAEIICCIKTLNVVKHFLIKNNWMSPGRKVKVFCSLKILA